MRITLKEEREEQIRHLAFHGVDSKLDTVSTGHQRTFWRGVMQELLTEIDALRKEIARRDDLIVPGTPCGGDDPLVPNGMMCE